ncbi:MAG: hypothetical protein DRG78_07965 [Epsilonproteobacteria bacterium]|nr:MAG: hypothetical protein DRG78_07965 [Campylobacterota bacterium]
MNNFTLLQNCINDNNIDIGITSFSHPLYIRLIKSFINGFSDKSLLDIAVLLRQILLNESASRGNNDFASLRIPTSSIWPSEKEYNKVGIEFTKLDKYFSIHAKWWNPDWIGGSDRQSVDFNAVSEINARDNVHFKSTETDIFLKSLNQEDIINYKSSDQQRAVRSALSLDSGETLAISLPTGEGKSLIFQLVDLIGFSETNNNGLTLVVVPTVT